MSEQQHKRERIAYEELQVGDPIMDGDEWQNNDGRWQLFAVAPIQVLEGSRVRRPYAISTILEIGDALADAQQAATQLQDERDNACRERDLARAEVARLSTELWARKPLEERVASLTEELAQAREASQQLLQTITDNADQFAWASKTLEQERDEARAERDRLQEVVGNLHNEPTARQVRDMLRTWATELDWSECCFDMATRDKVSAVQRVLGSVIERVESLCREGNDDN